MLEWCYGDCVMVECYVYGCELICVVMGDVVFGVMEIVLKVNMFYDYDLKYVVGGFEYIFFV